MMHPEIWSLTLRQDFTFRNRTNQDIERPIPSYCSPVPSGAGDGSSDGPRFDETRLPDWQPPGSSSIRSESPRQTQYALGNIQLQAMESQTGSFNPQTDMSGTELRGIFPHGTWSNAFNNDGAPIGMNPIINNSINVNPFDTDMSDAANQSSSNSNGLTPASTNTYHSNSNSTYSPPQVEDENTGTMRVQPKTQSAFSTYVPSDGPLFPGTHVLNADSTKSPGNNSATNGQEDPFKMPAGWDVNTGTTPGFLGMTPDGGWEKLMQDGGWEKMMQDGTWIDQNQRTGMTPR